MEVVAGLLGFEELPGGVGGLERYVIAERELKVLVGWVG